MTGGALAVGVLAAPAGASPPPPQPANSAAANSGTHRTQPPPRARIGIPLQHLCNALPVSNNAGCAGRGSTVAPWPRAAPLSQPASGAPRPEDLRPRLAAGLPIRGLRYLERQRRSICRKAGTSAAVITRPNRAKNADGLTISRQCTEQPDQMVLLPILDGALSTPAVL